jgi:hypothetical protein
MEYEPSPEFETREELETPPPFEPEEELETPPAFEPDEELETPPAFEPDETFEAPPAFEPEETFQTPPPFEPEEELETPPAFEPEETFEAPPAFEPEETFEPPPAFEPEETFEPPPAEAAEPEMEEHAEPEMEEEAEPADEAFSGAASAGEPAASYVTAEIEGAEEKPIVPTPTFGKRDPTEKAKRLARVLVSDIILYNPDRHHQAMESGRIKEEFEEEIQKSWNEYVEQVGEAVANSTSFFNDALNEILAKGDQIF